MFSNNDNKSKYDCKIFIKLIDLINIKPTRFNEKTNKS